VSFRLGCGALRLWIGDGIGERIVGCGPELEVAGPGGRDRVVGVAERVGGGEAAGVPGPEGGVGGLILLGFLFLAAFVLVEPRTTLNTGNVVNERTVTRERRL